MDNLANLFSAIQNGQQRQKKFIRVPFSKKSWNLCNILFIEGFLQGFFAQENHLYIFLKYSQNKPVLRKISKISLQGRKIYIKAMSRKNTGTPTEKRNSELKSHSFSSKNIEFNVLPALSSLKVSDSSLLSLARIDIGEANIKLPINTVSILDTAQYGQTQYASNCSIFQGSITSEQTYSKRSQLSFRETRQRSFCVKILSTSKGILSDRDARFFGIGGELLCEIF